MPFSRPTWRLQLVQALEFVQVRQVEPQSVQIVVEGSRNWEVVHSMQLLPFRPKPDAQVRHSPVLLEQVAQLEHERQAEVPPGE